MAPSDIGNYTVIGFAKGNRGAYLIRYDSSEYSFWNGRKMTICIHGGSKLSDTYNLG